MEKWSSCKGTNLLTMLVLDHRNKNINILVFRKMHSDGTKTNRITNNIGLHRFSVTFLGVDVDFGHSHNKTLHRTNRKKNIFTTFALKFFKKKENIIFLTIIFILMI